MFGLWSPVSHSPFFQTIRDLTLNGPLSFLDTTDCSPDEVTDKDKDKAHAELIKELPLLVTKAISTNTFTSYAHGFQSWQSWATQHAEITCLPANEFHLALYIASINQRNGKYSRVRTVFYWIHNALNLPNPCKAKTVTMVLETAKRTLQTTVKKCLHTT